MKICRFLVPMTVALGLAVSGCEWQNSGDDGTYNDSQGYDWANFSGTYYPVAGGSAYVVVAPGPSVGSDDPASKQTVTEPFSTSGGAAVGNGVNSTFAGVLGEKPIVPGSVSVTDGFEVLYENGTVNGTLLGTLGGSGFVNYDTGSITVTFAIPPGSGKSITASYQYYISGSPENPATGSGKGISSLSVKHYGNTVEVTDNYGATYSGHFSFMTLPPATATNSTASGTFHVTANFEATGQSTWNTTVTIAGTFEGTKNVDDGSMRERRFEGTWIENDGSGTIYGVADTYY